MFENKQWAEADSDITLQDIVDNAQKLMAAVRGPMSINTDEDAFLASILSSIIVFKNGEPLTVANGGILVDMTTGNVTLVVAPQKGDVVLCEYPYCPIELSKIKRLHPKKHAEKRPYYNKNRW